MVQTWQPNSRAIVCKIPPSLFSWQYCVLEAELPHNRRDSHHTACRVELSHRREKKKRCQQHRESNHSITEGRADAERCCFSIFVKLAVMPCWESSLKAERRGLETRRVSVHTLKKTEICECGTLWSPWGNLVFVLPISLCLLVRMCMKTNVSLWLRMSQ